MKDNNQAKYMKSIKYIEIAKNELGKKLNCKISYYKLAKEIGITQSALSHYLKGKRVMDNFTAFRLSEIIGITAESVIVTACADKERMSDDYRKDYWDDKINERNPEYIEGKK